MGSTSPTHLLAINPSGSFALGEDDIDLWTVMVTALHAGMVDGVGALSSDELARASRFRSEVDRTCFVQRRIALRAILAGYLGVAPGEIVFTQTKFGRPSIFSPRSREILSFSTSHSEAIAVIAIGRSAQIGIDIERLRPIAEAESIAARFFATAEAATLASLHPDQQAEGFLNAWTRKEAVVKALGGGLSIPLNSFEVSLQPGEPAAILSWGLTDAALKHWRMHHIEPALGYVGALVTGRWGNIRKMLRWRIGSRSNSNADDESLGL